MSAHGTFRAPPVEDLQRHFTQYKIEEFVAVGGMGAVYRATQSSVDRPVALKILPPEMAKDETFRTHFALEAKAMAKLNHRNLVQLYDFGETNGVFWMIQEWVAGRTIFEVMHEEKRLAPKEAAALVAQACEGLGYAHKQGIVHRDVKPANMMVDEDGILKVMDFGLAGIHGAEGMKTQAGGRYATEEYAAPELWDLSRKVDHRVDIFALGVLLYETLTGERPMGTFRMPSELRPGLDQRYDAIVVRAMQRERENRYDSCGELLKALRAVVTSPPKVKLQTKKPATDGLRLRTPPPPPRRVSVSAAAPPKKSTGAVALVAPALAATPTPVAAPVGPSLKKKKSSRGMIALVSILILLGLLGGGWLVLSAGKGKDPDQGTAGESGGAGENGGEGSARKEGSGETNEGGSTARSEAESVRERIERRARAQAARLAAASRDNPPDPDPGTDLDPDPDPDPSPAPTPAPTPAGPADDVAQVLKALDEELRSRVAGPYRAYAEAAGELEERYLAECQKEEDDAVEAGDLDGVLFWQAEARALKKGGDVPADESEAPARAVTLRKSWRARMEPLKAALTSAQSAYRAKCSELHQAAESQAAKSALRERRERAGEFHNFLALCAGEAPPFLGDPFEGPEVERIGSQKPQIGGSLSSLDDDLKAGRLTRLPTGSKEYQGNYYLIVPGPLNWKSAIAWCEARGGHLATLARQAEWEWFSDNMSGEGVLVHLGAQKQGDQWVWITAEDWSGTPRWVSGQPNNSGGNQSVLGWETNGFNDLSQGPIAFVIEWEADAFAPDTLARIAGLLPAPMVTAYKSTVARLDQLEQAGDTKALGEAIKIYGRTLVQSERALTRERKINAAKAMRQIKEEMLLRLERISGTATPGSARVPAPRGNLERVVIVERGGPTDQCEFDRKEWRRKGRALTTGGMDRDNGIYPTLTAAPSIGRGDFRIEMKLTKGRIGATSLQVWLGETLLYLDDENGRIYLQRCGASIKTARGKNLGSLAESGAPMEIVIQRKGTSLQVTVNGKPGLEARIHDRELGKLVLGPGSTRLELEHLAIEGTIDAPLEDIKLVSSRHLGWQGAVTQLVPTGNDGLTSLILGYDSQTDSNRIIARRSRDGGKEWDDIYSVIAGDELSAGMTSLAAACDTRRDQLYLVVGAGRANQQIFVTLGRNGGRNWSKPVEITATAKQRGWNVWLGGQGLVISRGQKNPGRVILPMLAGQDENSSLYMLVSDDSGREWKPIGPLTKTNSTAELMEDEKGVLWAAVKGPSSGGVRRTMSSVDGGDTWSEATQSTLPDARTRGSLALGEDANKRPVWYYASTKVETDEDGGAYRTNLTLYGSRDQGKTWAELRRMHFGGWSYPTVVSLGPNRCGIGFRRDVHSTNYQQIRFVAADGLWGK